MKVLLTGATGFLGNNLLRVLNQTGLQALCIVRGKHAAESLQGLAFEPVRLDLSDLKGEQLDQLPDFDCCIHSAALINIGWTRFDEARQINVEATRRLAQVCLQRNKRFVFVSTVNTLACSTAPEVIHEENDRQPACPPFCYPVTKREGELAVDELEKQGLDAVTVHAGFMLGRWDWRPSSAEMMVALAKQKPPFSPRGGTNTADVRDVAWGLLLAAQRGRTSEHYILGGENLTYFELWNRMAAAAGVRGPKFRLPDWLAVGGGLAGDLFGRLRFREGSLNSAAARMGQLFHYYSSDKAARELGYAWSPIEEAIQDSAAWCRERGWIR